MKKISKKVREGVINRFFETANELPHSINYLNKEGNWRVFECKSSNNCLQIGFNENTNEFIRVA